MESRTDLLDWLNRTFELNYTKVEQMGTGSAYCQIMDAIYRDVPLSKVRFDANQEYMYVNNFKVLQTTFDQHRVDKEIPVGRLVKCKFQDNLEFFQWIKKFFDMHYPGGEYDAVARRRSKPSLVPSKPKPALQTPAMRKDHTLPGTEMTTVVPRGMTSHPMGHGDLGKTQTRAPLVENHATNVTTRVGPHVDSRKVEELAQQVNELKTIIEGLEKERDFYFGKLRDIEILCQNDNSNEITLGLREKIQSILYTTEEGFEPPNEEVALQDDETF
jgi:microtubule-associated protein, RP/EB family